MCCVQYDREFDEDEGGGDGLNCRTDETFEDDISKFFGDGNCTGLLYVQSCSECSTIDSLKHH